MKCGKCKKIIKGTVLSRLTTDKSKQHWCMECATKDAIMKAARLGSINQKIQMMIWDYMSLPIGKRDASKVANAIIDMVAKEKKYL